MGLVECDECEGCGFLSGKTGEPWSNLVGTIGIDQEHFNDGSDTDDFRIICGSCNSIGRVSDDPAY